MLSGKVVLFSGPSPDTPKSDVEERLELEQRAIFVGMMLGCTEKKARKLVAKASSKALRLMVGE